MKITMTKAEVTKALESVEVRNDILKAVRKEPQHHYTVKDTFKMINEMYEAFKDINKNNCAIKISINFKSNENFIWIEINPAYISDYLDLYYSYIKEVIPPMVAVVKSTMKLINKANHIDNRYFF